MRECSARAELVNIIAYRAAGYSPPTPYPPRMPTVPGYAEIVAGIIFAVADLATPPAGGAVYRPSPPSIYSDPQKLISNKDPFTLGVQ